MNIVSAYGKAGTEIRNMLLNIDIETIDSVKADSVMNQTRRIVAGLHLSAEKWIDEDLKKAYNTGTRKAKTSLQVLGFKPVKPAYTSKEQIIGENAFNYFYLANKSMMDMVDNYLSIILYSRYELDRAKIQSFDFEDIEEEVDLLAIEAVKEQYSHQVLKGQILEKLSKYIKEDKFLEIKGRKYNPKKYAEMVARTELRKAQTEGVLSTCKSYECDLVEVSSHGTKCEECSQYEGNVYSISGSDPVYESLDFYPPFHPNCEHSIRPTSREAIEVRSKYE